MASYGAEWVKEVPVLHTLCAFTLTALKYECEVNLYAFS